MNANTTKPEPFQFGDILRVRPAAGRIERPCFVVVSSNKVFGGDEYRYDGVFPGEPGERLLHGKVYSPDIVDWTRSLPEKECHDLLQENQRGTSEH